MRKKPVTKQSKVEQVFEEPNFLIPERPEPNSQLIKEILQNCNQLRDYFPLLNDKLTPESQFTSFSEKFKASDEQLMDFASVANRFYPKLVKDEDRESHLEILFGTTIVMTMREALIKKGNDLETPPPQQTVRKTKEYYYRLDKLSERCEHLFAPKEWERLKSQIAMLHEKNLTEKVSRLMTNKANPKHGLKFDKKVYDKTKSELKKKLDAFKNQEQEKSCLPEEQK